MVDERLWFGLIEHWRPRGMGNTGPTLPFLIGATRIAGTGSGAPNIADLSDLLYSLQGTGSPIFIANCSTLHQPIVTLCDQSATMMLRDLIKKPNGAGSSLYVSREDYDHSGDITSATKALWTIVETAVTSEHYSFNDGRYGDYRCWEVEYIHDIQRERGQPVELQR